MWTAPPRNTAGRATREGAAEAPAAADAPGEAREAHGFWPRTKCAARASEMLVPLGHRERKRKLTCKARAPAFHFMEVLGTPPRLLTRRATPYRLEPKNKPQKLAKCAVGARLHTFCNPQEQFLPQMTAL